MTARSAVRTMTAMRYVAVIVLVAMAAPGAAADRMKSPEGAIRDVKPESVDFALRDGWTRIPQLEMRTPDGRRVFVYDDQVADAAASGYTIMMESEKRLAAQEEIARARADATAREAASDGELWWGESKSTWTVAIGLACLGIGLLYVGRKWNELKRGRG